MRILAIRGKNLASLERFDVEFESGPLEHAGIFAITGPTGAGKTTLLDALCVALFDRTPRLSNKAGVPVGTADQDDGERVRANDVRGLLRRGAADGFAEVDFVGRDGRTHRARWSVHRSRRRASGKLQASEVSLMDLETEQIVSGKKTETLEAIEDKLGLSFEQFRRSALLAQNDFAAFLRADEKQRSDLLERMTGTDIYTKVSIAAFRRAVDETKELTALQDSADASAILDDESRAALIAKRDVLRQRHKETNAAVQAAQSAVLWFTEVTRAKGAIGEALLAQKLAQEAAAAQASSVARIAAVREARDKRSIVDAEREAREAATAAAVQRDATIAEVERATVLLAKCTTAVSSAKEAVASARAKHVQALEAELVRIDKRTAVLREWLAEHKEFASSGGEVRAFVEMALEALDELQPDLEERTQKLAEEAGKARKLEVAARKKRDAAKDDSEALAKQVEGSKLAELREGDARLVKQAAGTQSLLSMAKAIARATKLQLRAEEERTKAAAELVAHTAEAKVVEQQEKTCSAAFTEAQAAFDRIRLALDLSEHRAKLVAGEHCPLCGSEEHPWREHDATASVVGAQEARALTLRGELEVLREARAEVRTQIRAAEHVAQKAAEEVALREGEVAHERAQAAALQAQPILAERLLSIEESTLEQAIIDTEETHKELRNELFAAETLDTKARGAAQIASNAAAAWAEASELRQTSEQQHQEAIKQFVACQGYRYRSRDNELKALESARAVCEEKRLAAPTWLPQAEQAALLAAEEAVQKANHALATAQAELKERVARVSATAALREETATKLATLLQGMACTKEVLLERLAVTDVELAALEEGVSTANRQVAEAEGRLRERELRLVELQAKQPEGLVEAEAIVQQEREEKLLEEIVEEGVKVGAELLADSEARKRRDALGDKIVAATERVRIFRTLSDLIGSADGKKFRVFAQSLTLDSLLAGANAHLKDLAPRYLLERVPGHDLDLQVVDRDLADEVRSVNSLSGGESFLISLALALGLSSLAAKDVRVESLLVDEGFGSLDGDTLEVALSVLDSLQATGRKVGLISHVPGFAERIGAQVIVTPKGGGRSSVHVQGPMSYR
tara:strand:- start:21924 stop:25214 length:3291 start_codon:yes stop_codon:yes gene_type:complete